MGEQKDAAMTVRSSESDRIDGKCDDAEAFERAFENDPSFQPREQSRFLVESVVLDVAEVDALLSGLAYALSETSDECNETDRVGAAANISEKGSDYESHTQTDGCSGGNPGLPASPWLFANDAGTGRPARDEQGHYFRARRRPGKKRVIRRDRHMARSLTIISDEKLPDENRNTKLPLLGSIAAGVPIEAVENREELDLETMFNARNGVYVLRVRGESMIEDHLCDGDYVVIERRENARNGEQVVALLTMAKPRLNVITRRAAGRFAFNLRIGPWSRVSLTSTSAVYKAS